MCDYSQINEVSLRLSKQYNSKLRRDGLLIYTEQSPVYTEYIRSIEVKRLLTLLESKLQTEEYTGKQLPLRWLFVAKIFEQMLSTSIEEIVDPVLSDPKYTYNEFMLEEFRDRGLSADILKEMIPQVRLSLKRIAEYVDNYELIVDRQTTTRTRGRGRGGRGGRRGRGGGSSTVTVTRWRVAYGPSETYISTDMMNWLRTLYNAVEDNDPDDTAAFNADLYRMVTRYLTIGNIGTQASAPSQFYNYAVDNLGVHHECFASPLNANMNSYTSAYPDVDYPFGSLGSFFQLREIFPDGGSFAANPPFLAPIMDSMMLYIVDWMNSTDAPPLSFIVIMPDWTDNNAYNTALDNDHLITYDTVIPKESHRYVLRRLTSDELRSMCDTRLLILQNNSGAEQWPVSQEQADGLVEAFTAAST